MVALGECTSPPSHYDSTIFTLSPAGWCRLVTAMDHSLKPCGHICLCCLYVLGQPYYQYQTAGLPAVVASQ